MMITRGLTKPKKNSPTKAARPATWTHFDVARRRSFVVLQRMREEKKITPEQEQMARAELVRIRPQSAVSNARQGYAKEFLRQQFRDIYGGDNPPDWKVHTSFVPEIQQLQAEGHELGLHGGMDHVIWSRRFHELPDEDLAADVDESYHHFLRHFGRPVEQ